MRYPATKLSGPGAGFQSPVPNPRKSSPRRSLPRPANDNRPRPANDNLPKNLRDRFPNRPTQRLPRGPYMGLARGALRLVPYLGLGLLLYELYQWYSSTAGGWAFPSGWSRHHLTTWSPHPTKGWHSRTYKAHSHTNCRDINYQPLGTTDTSVNGFGTPNGIQITDESMQVLIGPRNNSSVARYDIREAWARDEASAAFPGPIEIPWRNPVPQPPILPAVPPWIDPLPMPIGVPLPVPSAPPYRAIPYRRRNMRRSPTEQSTRSNGNQARNPAPRPNPKRTPPRTKEKKIMSRAARAILAVWSAATEIPDWVDAFYDALPDARKKQLKKALGRKPTMTERANFAYRYLEEVDIGKATGNAAYNVIEDAVVGFGIGKMRDVGLGVGLNGLPYVLR